MRRLVFCAVPILTLAVLLGACEEGVNPILESDRRFTLWGTLDMNRDTQYVRVISIRETIVPEAGAPFEATVRSIDLVSGETLDWRDSTVVFGDGTAGHVFYTLLRPRPAHTYRLEVRAPGSDLVTSAETTMPARPEPVVLPENVEIILTTQVRASQQILWQGLADEPFAIEQWYRFFAIEDFSFRDVPIPYQPRHGPAEAPGTWEVILNLRQDRDTLGTILELDEPGLALAGLGMRITVLDTAFVPPGGVFDPDVLAQPGTLSNVENGFGFVGAVGRFSVEWILADTSARLLKYEPLGRNHPEMQARPGK